MRYLASDNCRAMVDLCWAFVIIGQLIAAGNVLVDRKNGAFGEQGSILFESSRRPNAARFPSSPLCNADNASP